MPARQVVAVSFSYPPNWQPPSAMLPRAEDLRQELRARGVALDTCSEFYRRGPVQMYDHDAGRHVSDAYQIYTYVTGAD